LKQVESVELKSVLNERPELLESDKFGRIEIILLDGKTSKRLDLTDEIVRNKVRGVKIIDQLKQLMA